MRMNNGGCGCGNKGMNGMGRQGMMRMQAEEPYGKRDLKENLEDYKEELEEEIKFINRRIDELSKNSSEDSNSLVTTNAINSIENAIGIGYPTLIAIVVLLGINRLKNYSNISEIPSDPYNVSVALVKQMVSYWNASLSPPQNCRILQSLKWLKQAFWDNINIKGPASATSAVHIQLLSSLLSSELFLESSSILLLINFISSSSSSL